MHTGQGPDRDAAEKVNSAVQFDGPCLDGKILTSTICVNAGWQRVSCIIIVISSAAVFSSLEAIVCSLRAYLKSALYAKGWLINPLSNSRGLGRLAHSDLVAFGRAAKPSLRAISTHGRGKSAAVCGATLTTSPPDKVEMRKKALAIGAAARPSCVKEGTSRRYVNQY